MANPLFILWILDEPILPERYFIWLIQLSFPSGNTLSLGDKSMICSIIAQKAKKVAGKRV
ncbi:hypothetical protein [Advenella mimigardefordensis]|uniref:hypothetical protein n=1 Tax=Advenella mimigardefordensis TaxID=302406 RepID=UPI00130E47C3|nr:hypothetical protein [Advenella mimigardefordensis]